MSDPRRRRLWLLLYLNAHALSLLPLALLKRYEYAIADRGWTSLFEMLVLWGLLLSPAFAAAWLYLFVRLLNGERIMWLVLPADAALFAIQFYGLMPAIQAAREAA